VAGSVMNIFNHNVTPHFYTIITFSFGCAAFLPGAWFVELNFVCLATYA
jgi:hypothetical protein